MNAGVVSPLGSSSLYHTNIFGLSRGELRPTPLSTRSYISWIRGSRKHDLDANGAKMMLIVGRSWVTVKERETNTRFVFANSSFRSD
jgi:hypothetical protein